MYPGPVPDAGPPLLNSKLPLVSVITPTWGRHDLLMSRCIPSVCCQSYGNIEHVVVSDGPDPELAHRLSANGPDGRRSLLYYELASHDPEPHYGHWARLAGIEYAHGDLIAYCDDDDMLRVDHVKLLARALADHEDAGFAVSRMVSHGPGGESVIGWGPLACGNVGTPMIMHRRSLLEHGSWGPAGQFEDWDLVLRWLNAGATCTSVDAETSDVWPSVFGH
jgi:glycosyl transferase family 2